MTTLMPYNLGIFNILRVMPNLRNAKKALKQSKKRALKNKAVKDAYRTATKTVKKAITAGEVVTEKVQLAQKKLDKAAKVGVLSKKTAARKLSRLMKQVHKNTKK